MTKKLSKWPAIADAFLAAMCPTLRYLDGSFFEYCPDLGAYRLVGLPEMKARIYDYLDTPNTKNYRETVSALQARCLLRDDQHPPCWLGDDHPDHPAHEMIAHPGGLLHARTGAIYDATPALFTLSALAVPYDPDAPKPVEWLKYIEQSFPGDEESQQALQEWTGYLLTTDTSQQKALLLIGPPRSGKGVWSQIVHQLVGRNNYASINLSNLEQGFGLQTLIGKTVAVVGDARLVSAEKARQITERILTLTGEDAPAIPRKYKPDWEGQLAVRFSLMSNEVPALVDHSGALASRLIALRHTRSHLGKEDPALVTRLSEELPGILVWAVDGLQRLYERGYFVQPAAGRELLETMESPIQTFVSERSILEPDGSVPCSDLFREWGDWCEETNHTKGNRATFGRAISAAYPQIGRSRRTDEGSRQWHYTGIRLVQGVQGPSILGPGKCCRANLCQTVTYSTPSR
jgi:putative DNA primase/helicase